MGSKKHRFSMFLNMLAMFYMAFSPCIVKAEKNIYRADALDSFIRDFTFKKIVHPHTGAVYNISLPSNFSGIDVVVVRLRSGSFYKRGLNHSFFEIPPKVSPWPYVTRFYIVYQNLGNWSTSYFNVPNHTLAGPVLGFQAYFSNSSEAESTTILLNVMEDPIQVRFPVVPGYRNETLKCVRFGHEGEIEFKNITRGNICLFKSQGHFAIVAPFRDRTRKKKSRRWKWWVIGVAIGVAVLVLLFFIIVVLCKIFKAKIIGKMERKSEKSEGLSTIWIGGSKMPSGIGIRTEPVLEHSYTYVP